MITRFHRLHPQYTVAIFALKFLINALAIRPKAAVTTFMTHLVKKRLPATSVQHLMEGGKSARSMVASGLRALRNAKVAGIKTKAHPLSFTECLKYNVFYKVSILAHILKSKFKMMFKPSYIVYFTFFLLITNLVPMTQSYTIPPTKTILVMGACCMDRSIPVSTYPNEDTKIRSDDPIVESGGGNGANTACAIANLISSSNYEDGVQIQVRLLSKVGDDAVGKSLLSELKEAGVDTTFVRVQSRTTSSLTHIIVANNAITGQSSRTCIHTPGSCGELTSIDIDEMHFDAIFAGNVVHFHSDSRHTSAAKILAEEAKRRGISVSVDAEKDRGSGDFDTLLELADILFTNQDMCKDYLRRSTTSTRSDSDLRLSLKSKDNDVDQIRAKNLLRHFILKYDQSRKIVVATRGIKGCYSVNTCENI